MHGIIRLDTGYYHSEIFAMSWLGELRDRFVIALNRDRTAPVRVGIFGRGLDQRVLITDGDMSRWAEGLEWRCVGFLAGIPIGGMPGNIPPELAERCIALDRAYSWQEVRPVLTGKDADDLMWAAGDFHDGYIKELEPRSDGSLRVLFSGTWGCSVELVFSGNVEYDASSRQGPDSDPYWFGASCCMSGGFVWLIDEEHTTPEEIEEGLCWFRARSLTWRVIPSPGRGER